MMKTKSTLVLALISFFGIFVVAVAEPEPEATYANREVGNSVAPLSKTSRSLITTSTLEEVVASMKENQDFSSYNEDDLRAAEEWFLVPENHPNDGKEEDPHYMKERLTLALMYFANCKEYCKLKYRSSGWLVRASDHCLWSGVACNSANEITKLNLRNRKLSQSFTLFELDHLRVLNLNSNNLSGDFVVASFSMKALRKLLVSRNQLKGVSGLQYLPELKSLHLFSNILQGEFTISKDTFPLSIQWLNLKQNKLTKITGVHLLTNLRGLDLSSNSFERFVIKKETFPPTIKWLHLKQNNLTTITGVNFLTNLKGLYLADNSFEGEFSVTKDNFPDSLESLGLNRNALIYLNIDDDAVPDLRNLFLIGTNNVAVNKEVCDRNMYVSPPSEICPCEKVESYASDGSVVGGIIESLLKEQDFSSYCQDNFDTAKEWFLDVANHPSDGKQNDANYMKERFILALIHSANCKTKCTLESSWLTAKDHCDAVDWEGVQCNEENEIQDLDLSRNGLNGSFTMFGFKSLTILKLWDNKLSGTFTVAGGSPYLSNIGLGNNRVASIAGAGVLMNLKYLYLSGNEFSGDLTITTNDFSTSIEYLMLSENRLTGFINGEVLTNLRAISLGYNEFVGDLIITEDKFPSSLMSLHLSGNKLTGFVDGGLFLPNLKQLYLSDNELTGKIHITAKDYPASLLLLMLNKNGLSGISGGGILTNLNKLILTQNQFEGKLTVTSDNFPTTIKLLFLGENELTGFIGGGILKKLKELHLNDNKFAGDLVITADDYPKRLLKLDLSANKGLKSINADSDAVPNLNTLNVEDIDGVIMKEELCGRSGISCRD
ncbi:hypothetical protein CTEN210_08963 [Chaetoceros tenuissimus]|uniref:Leucine-rich repeat-containing N-terminal plant-type domain-containing protein n=1 Tax=Chaetoceros tenuissimus TaxID=426638 RepID=A0AAD3H6J8_9STRA|nr:hypothetical protein CTEN210_08963 [Chaetoceros tenuissimus]